MGDGGRIQAMSYQLSAFRSYRRDAEDAEGRRGLCIFMPCGLQPSRRLSDEWKAER